MPVVFVREERRGSEIPLKGTGSVFHNIHQCCRWRGLMAALGTEHGEVAQSDIVMFQRGPVRCPPVVAS